MNFMMSAISLGANIVSNINSNQRNNNNNNNDNNDNLNNFNFATNNNAGNNQVFFILYVFSFTFISVSESRTIGDFEITANYLKMNDNSTIVKINQKVNEFFLDCS
jgi:hypothetical protein